ncbi:hypothetical protein [Saccharolobus islandicus]|uniref:Uncharacterized protein n=1 Tax=Saccharolobus islandicus LAL14/1 TaxID=1241935 RepID=M9UCP3_SACIS|nr:hypothetical protein [Sulfolobus islandicus]AGJ61930.1 Hypothetical Protein SiL_0458 [Sulfolobus islandicus LAL14/1]
MMRSRSFQIFRVIFKERYRQPTLELVIPTMLVSNIFITAFYARGLFNTYGLVLAFIPLISVSETLAFALALRNIIFVTGDHIYRGSIISFIMIPIKRISLFFFTYFCDIVLPYLFWLFTTEIYILLSGIPVPQYLILVYTVGYFFTENIILLTALSFKSGGIVTLLSGTILGILFIFGGIAGYYGIMTNSPLTPIATISNPYVFLIYEAISQKQVTYLNVGIYSEVIISLILFFVSLQKFRMMEV